MSTWSRCRIRTIYDKTLLDASTGTNSFDAYVFDPQWMGDFVTPGYLLDLTDRVNNDPTLDWQDIGPFFRDFNATYNGKVYTIPLDGDFHMVYYRKDLLDKDGLKPPATWDDYLAIAQKYNGQDLNGDGQPDYGSCIAKALTSRATGGSSRSPRASSSRRAPTRASSSIPMT